MARRWGEAWIGARCEYCGAEWTRESKEQQLRYDFKDDSIVCYLGRGCSRRRPTEQKQGHARLGDGVVYAVPLYLYEGVWYSCAELAALADVSYFTMRARLQKGWSVRDAVHPPAKIAKGDEWRYKKHLGVALLRAGGTPLYVPKSVDSTKKRGASRPAKQSAPTPRPRVMHAAGAALTAREWACRLGVTCNNVYRWHAAGTLERHVARIESASLARSTRGPRPRLYEAGGLRLSLREWLVYLGRSERRIRDCAERKGRTIEQEIALRVERQRAGKAAA